MKMPLFVIILFSCSICTFGREGQEWNYKCEMLKMVKRDIQKVEMNSFCAEYFHKQDSIRVINDSLSQYLSKRLTITVVEKKKVLKFNDVNIQDFSRKNGQNGRVFFSLVAKHFFDSTSTLIPKKRIEKTGYWLVPCHMSWYEDGINDGETAVCLSKDSVWPCFEEW